MLIGHHSWWNVSNISRYGYYTSSIYGMSNALLANNLNKYSSFNNKNGIPSGYNPHYTWAMPLKNGGLAMLEVSAGSVYDALLASAKNCQASITGEGSVYIANLQNLVEMAATIISSGGVDKASMAGILAMLATNITGQGTISKADLGAIIGMLSTIESSGGVNYAELLGQCFCSAHIYVNEGTATTEQIVDAIWDELTSSHTITGSTGKALLDAGSAGNPWGSLTSTNDDPGTFGELVQDIKQGVIGSQGLILGA